MVVANVSDPFQVVRDFEAALCGYTGAPYAVAVNSCTMALLLAAAWWKQHDEYLGQGEYERISGCPTIEIPKRTYVSVPQSIVHAGYRVKFRDEDWCGAYQLKPLPVLDSARKFTGGMYKYGVIDSTGTSYTRFPGLMQCVSFHHSKILGDSQGGAILLDDHVADDWLRRARFDGRTEGVEPKNDAIMLGWHCYMSPDVAARLLWKLSKLPLHNEDLPNDDYPDLSAMECFR